MSEFDPVSFIMGAKSAGGGGGGGGGGGALVVHETYDEGVHTLDKTWQEIVDAIQIGPVLRVDVDASQSRIDASCFEFADVWQGEYSVAFVTGGLYSTNDPDGYPSFSDE